MEPDTDWQLVEPGLIVLPPTQYAIRWNGISLFIVEWAGAEIGGTFSIDSAKERAMQHMRQLLEMGLDP